MNEFKNFHPSISFLYFVAVIASGMFFLHPVCLCISLFSSFLCVILVSDKKTIKRQCLFLLPMMMVTALFNPLFNHQGVTILAYLPGGNPLTLESVIYGIVAAMMLITVINWFSCYNKIMTSDKFIYLFGKMIPSLSLIFSMTLRFVPSFITQFKLVTNAQKGLGNDIARGSLSKRMKRILTLFSIMITWSLENAAETADSMKSRGYGLSGRSSFSIYTFDSRDKRALLYLLGLLGYVLIGAALGQTRFYYFPAMDTFTATPYRISIFIAYFLLCSMPVWLELMQIHKKEAKQWINTGSML